MLHQQTGKKLTTFASLGIPEAYIRALKENKIDTPTEIQEKTIPILLENRTDFVGIAQTGTGKTAAFGLPLLQKIDPEFSHIQGLILAPTRELAKQIGKELFRFTKYCKEKIFTEVVCGGDKIDVQIQRLQRTTHILVATPGRLQDLLDRQVIDLSHVSYAILDEADEMLNMGFKKDIDWILRFVPKERHSWLFSATMAEDVKSLIKHFMKADYEEVTVSQEQVVNKNISHFFKICPKKEKLNHLVKFIKRQGMQKGIIFCKTRQGVRQLVKQLIEKGYNTAGLEGEMYQSERDKVMRGFRGKRIQFVVATDVAARGIDIQDIAYVAHYDLPEQDEYYTHRSGRTARAGRKGISVSFILEEEVDRIDQLSYELDIEILPI